MEFAIKRQHTIFLAKYGRGKKTMINELIDRVRTALFKKDE